MSLEPKSKWNTPPIFELLLKLQYRIAERRKQQLEQQIADSERMLRQYIAKAQKAFHGK